VGVSEIGWSDNRSYPFRQVLYPHYRPIVADRENTMYVKSLGWVEYGPTGWGWQSERILNPTWADIERAIRRLDRFRYPFVHLWITEDESKQLINGSGEVMEVIGGDGAWWLAVSLNGSFQQRIDYPERGDQEVPVWTSDQGFADAERHICRDLDVVLRAARHFAEHRELDPELQWDDGL
jgi:hypothetical protein